MREIQGKRSPKGYSRTCPVQPQPAGFAACRARGPGPAKLFARRNRLHVGGFGEPSRASRPCHPAKAGHGAECLWRREPALTQTRIPTIREGRNERPHQSSLPAARADRTTPDSGGTNDQITSNTRTGRSHRRSGGGSAARDGARAGSRSSPQSGRSDRERAGGKLPGQ